MEVQNVHIEQTVLGQLIKKGDLIKEVSLEEDYFSEPNHRFLFRAMKEIDRNGDAIDIISLRTYLGQDIDLYGGMRYLSELVNSIPTLENFKQNARHLIKTYLINESKDRLVSINEINSVKSFNDLRETINDVSNLLDVSEESNFDINEVLVEITEDVETEREGINGITTGLTELDHMLDGLQLQTLNIVAARPSVGKTAFALKIAESAARNGDFANVFSLEMDKKSILKRMICSIGGIDSMKIKNAKKRFDRSDWKSYTDAQTVLSEYKNNLNIYDKSAPTLQDIRAEVKKCMRKHPDKRHLIIIDYLTLIKTPGRQNRTIEIGELSRGLKTMARELNCSVLLLSQLNRSVESRQNKRPMMSDIRESGEVEQDADTISFLYREDYYDSEAPSNIVEVIIAKQRNGPIGTVEVFNDRDTGVFRDLDRRYDHANDSRAVS